MKEYTLLALISVVITHIVDRVSGTRLYRQKAFYFYLLFIFFIFLMVNGYLTSFIVMYNPKYFMGWRLGTIPLEDFFFGFSMITLSIVCWEKWKNKRSAI